MRLPTRVNLPFGYTVKVRLATPTQFGQWGEADSDGLWCAQERTIYIKKGLTVRRQRYLLVHELIHALNDHLHAFLDSGDLKP